MSESDRSPDAHPARPKDTHPALKVYTPRLDEFEEAVALARRRWDSLPDWLKASIKRRLHST